MSSTTQIPHLSHSRISTYRTCGERYRLAYIEQVPREPSGPAIGGTAIHQTIEVCEHEELWRDWSNFEPDGLATAIFNERFSALVVEAVEQFGTEPQWGRRKSRAFPTGETAEWWFTNGPVMLGRYGQVRRADDDAGVQLIDGSVERRFGAMLDDVLVMGYVDIALLASADGEGFVRDWKSGTWVDPSQLAIYAWGLEQDEKRPWHISHGEFVKLRSPNPEHRIKAYDLRPWVAMVPELFRQAREGIEAGYFPIMPSNLCPSCAVRRHCAWGKGLPDDDEGV